jgi:Cu+-exporting ATPase
VGAAEQGSEHPVARAIVDHARSVCDRKDNAGFEVATTMFEAHIGEGVRAQVDGHSVVVGRPSMFDDEKSIRADSGRNEDSTTVFVGIDGAYAGWIALNDVVKPEAHLAVAALRRLGVDVGMISGDNRAVANKVAKSVGISPELVFAQATPADKIDIIKKLQAPERDGDNIELDSHVMGSATGGRRVAMVGDGVNDSPALAAATVGITVAGATDVAMEAADVVLLRERALFDIPGALILSRSAFARIKVNLYAACVYNVLMIPFAMGVFLPFGLMLNPMAASGAMAMSSVSVVVSSLWLQRWQPPAWIEDSTNTDSPVDIEANTYNSRPSLWNRLGNLFTRTTSTGPRYQHVSG